MWTWDVKKINCIHSLKRVENLSIFLDIVTLLVDEGMRHSSRIARRLGLNRSTLERYRLQGKVCSGGRWCSGGSDCLGRFRMWHTYWKPVKRSYELLEDHRNSSFEAGMLEICLKASPHFFQFCQILSHGAYINQQFHSCRFTIFQRGENPLSLNESQLQQCILRRLRVRFGREIEIPNENVDQFVSWGRSLGIISRNPTFGRLEFEIRMFEKYLDSKNIFQEFSKDRRTIEGCS